MKSQDYLGCLCPGKPHIVTIAPCAHTGITTQTQQMAMTLLLYSKGKLKGM